MPIGEFMRDKITEFFKAQGLPCTVKYIDPSYMVRSVAANAADSIYCSLLAQVRRTMKICCWQLPVLLRVSI